jgi:hypothetical protein
MARIEPGTYVARSVGQSVYESPKTGALVLCLNCEVVDEAASGTSLKAYQTLVKGDGELMTKSIENMKQVFGWDGTDPAWFMDADLTGVNFKVVVEDETVTADDGVTKTYSKVKWVNPIDGTPGAAMPGNADKKSILNKYGSKFRALAGGTPVKKPANVVPMPPTTPPAPPQQQAALPGVPPPPAPAAPKKGKKIIAVSTQEKAWEACCNDNNGKSTDELSKVWYDTLARLYGGKPTADLRPEEWAKVHLQFTDDVPY